MVIIEDVRVLVVEDDVRMAAAIRRGLRYEGFVVDLAGGGEEALRLIRAIDYEAIVLDVMMPGLDGPGTVALLQADEVTRHIPVILLNAKVQPSDRERFAGLRGVYGVIAKPFDPMNLANEIALLLGWTD